MTELPRYVNQIYVKYPGGDLADEVHVIHPENEENYLFVPFDQARLETVRKATHELFKVISDGDCEVIFDFEQEEEE